MQGCVLTLFSWFCFSNASALLLAADNETFLAREASSHAARKFRSICKFGYVPF